MRPSHSEHLLALAGHPVLLSLLQVAPQTVLFELLILEASIDAFEHSSRFLFALHEVEPPILLATVFEF